MVCRAYSAKLIITVICYFCSIEFTAARRALSLLQGLKLPREGKVLKKIDADKPTYKAEKVNYIQKGS